MYWMQMYADSTDFTGLPDPSNNCCPIIYVVAPATADEDDGDQYVARKQRQYLETLFANANVRALIPCLAQGHPIQNLTCSRC